MSLRECSEIASEDHHFGTSYIGRRVLHPVYGCTYIHFLSQLTSNSHERRYSRWGTDGDVLLARNMIYKYYHTDNTVRFHVLSKQWYDSKLFSCHLIVGGDSLEGELVNSQAPKIAIYLHMYGSEASGQCTYKHRKHLSASDSLLALLPSPPSPVYGYARH